MSILAISLSPILIRYVERKSTIQVQAASDIQQALFCLENEDFTIVIEDTRYLQENAERDLALLVAATTPGTAIIALATPNGIPDFDYWRSQGITLLYREPPAEDLSKLLELSP